MTKNTSKTTKTTKSSATTKSSKSSPHHEAAHTAQGPQTPEAAKMPNWTVLAAALPSDEFKASLPLNVMLGEAIDIVRFFRKYWATEYDKRSKPTVMVRRGLELAGPSRLPATTGDEIEDLVAEVQRAHTSYQLTVDPKSITQEKMERGHFVLAEITSTLEWLFDDGVEDEHDAQLASLQAAHKNDAATADALALELEDYATLAQAHRKEIDGLGAFDASLIDEALTLAKALRALPPAPEVSSIESRVALNKRNRMLQLLQARMAKVRGAARFVYRAEGDVVREVTSTFERKRRADARRTAMKKGNGAPEVPAAPVVVGG